MLRAKEHNKVLREWKTSKTNRMKPSVEGNRVKIECGGEGKCDFANKEAVSLSRRARRNNNNNNDTGN